MSEERLNRILAESYKAYIGIRWNEYRFKRIDQGIPIFECVDDVAGTFEIALHYNIIYVDMKLNRLEKKIFLLLMDKFRKAYEIEEIYHRSIDSAIDSKYDFMIHVKENVGYRIIEIVRGIKREINRIERKLIDIVEKNKEFIEATIIADEMGEKNA